MGDLDQFTSCTTITLRLPSGDPLVGFLVLSPTPLIRKLGSGLLL